MPRPDGSEPVRPVRQVLQRPNRKLSRAEIDQLVVNYQAGQCLTELGKRYGLHRQTAKAHLERRDVTIRSELPAMMPEQVRAAGQLYESSSLSLVQVAARFEVAPNMLRRGSSPVDVVDEHERRSQPFEQFMMD